MTTRAHARDRWIALLTKTSSAIAPREVTEHSEPALLEPTRTVAEAVPAAIAAAAFREAVGEVLEAEVAEVSAGAADGGASLLLGWGRSRGANRLRNAGPQTLVQ